MTGSKFLVRANDQAILVDCGLFQGKKEYRLRNWGELPINPRELTAVVLTHAHLDHSGYLPALVRDGFRGIAHCTHATRELLGLLLPDSAHLMEEEAATANRLHYSKHAPARPLYTAADAKEALTRLSGCNYHEPVRLAPGIQFLMRPAGHILGSATVELRLEEAGRAPKRLLFSGDLGRYDIPVLPDPEQTTFADYLLVECTYGNRRHPTTSAAQALAEAITAGLARGGAIVIPSFAIGRAQELLYTLRELEQAGQIPVVNVFVDSPMATDATPIYVRHTADHDTEMKRLIDKHLMPFKTGKLHFTRTVHESQGINEVRSCIIISASGMATGGRVLNHLKMRLPDPRSTVLLVGWQGEGTRGRSLLDGAPTVKIHGHQIPVRAKVQMLEGFSAHADCDEMDRWLEGFVHRPLNTFCVHGEAEALEATRARLVSRGWCASVPAHEELVQL